MSSGWFKNVINKICLKTMYSIYMHKKDLGLNNLHCLICHKTKPNQTKSDDIKIFITSFHSLSLYLSISISLSLSLYIYIYIHLKSYIFVLFCILIFLSLRLEVLHLEFVPDSIIFVFYSNSWTIFFVSFGGSIPLWPNHSEEFAIVCFFSVLSCNRLLLAARSNHILPPLYRTWHWENGGKMDNARDDAIFLSFIYLLCVQSSSSI